MQTVVFLCALVVILVAVWALTRRSQEAAVRLPATIEPAGIMLGTAAGPQLVPWAEVTEVTLLAKRRTLMGRTDYGFEVRSLGCSPVLVRNVAGAADALIAHSHRLAGFDQQGLIAALRMPTGDRVVVYRI